MLVTQSHRQRRHFDNKVSNLPEKVEINIKRSFWRHDSLIRFFLSVLQNLKFLILKISHLFSQISNFLRNYFT